MADSMTYTGELLVQQCCACHMTFAVPPDFDAARRKDHASFCCPAGHRQSYRGKSDVEKVREELERTRRRLKAVEDSKAYWKTEAEHEERRARAYKGHLTRTKKKVAAGACPCCSRTFPDLADHMASEHPEYVEDRESDR